MDIKALQTRLREFAAARDWQPYHAPKNLAMALMVEAAELLPAYLFRIINGTREELVPAWRWLCDRLAENEGRFPVWVSWNRDAPRDPAAAAELLPCSPKVTWVADAEK